MAVMGGIKIFLLLSLGLTAAAASANEERSGRIFSYFNSITFKNEECTGNSDDQDIKGVCMTKEECNDIRGSEMGNCAQGFGTCCFLSKTECGGTISENNTYITNPEFPSPSTAAQTCEWTFERKDTDICFIRLDFATLELALANAADSGNNLPDKGACNIDEISYTDGSHSRRRGSLCGLNNGLHMYLEAGGVVDAMPVTFRMMMSGTATSRRWNIKTAQIPCGESYTPWQGCRQYFTKDAGRIKSYNFDGQYHLNLQEYTICVRRNQGMCRVQYMASEDANSFRLSGNGRINMASLNGRTNCMADYLNALFASSTAGGGCNTDFNNDHGNVVNDMPPTRFGNRFCGGTLGCRQLTQSTRGHVVQEMSPFELALHTHTKDTKSDTLNFGFSLDYTQLPC